MAPPSALTRRHLLAATTLGWAAGCTLAPDSDHDAADAPVAAPLPRPPRVAWVFSSGGPRGFVHVGVIKALDELGLRPDLLVGASAGALAAVLFAAGRTGAEIEQVALELQPMALARLAMGGEERLGGAAIRDLVAELVPERLLERLPTPAVCAAQRLGDGQVVGFSRGDAGLAVQAASAIEGRFSPVRIHGRRYADADQRMPLPVRIARGLGAAKVLAVDASAHEDRAPPGAERYREGDLRKRELTRPDAALADLLLHPDFGYWVSLSQAFRQRAIAAGYRETMAHAVPLRALHGQG